MWMGLGWGKVDPEPDKESTSHYDGVCATPFLLLLPSSCLPIYISL